MTDNDEFLAEDEGFPGSLLEQWSAMDQALKPYLKPDADWNIEAYLKLLLMRRTAA